MKKTSIFYVVSTIKISCCRLSVQGSVKLSIIMVRPGSVAGSTPEGVRKSLVQQQSKITVRDPSAHAVRQIRELDTFAAGIAEKNKARLDQIKRDREELVHIDFQIKTTSKKYNDLLDSLRFRRAERDRIRSHVAKCSADTNLLIEDTCCRTRWVHKKESKLLKSASSMELAAARGFASGPGTTFKRKLAHGSPPSGSAQTLPPLGGRAGDTGSMSHSISAPALRK